MYYVIVVIIVWGIFCMQNLMSEQFSIHDSLLQKVLVVIAQALHQYHTQVFTASTNIFTA